MTFNIIEKQANILDLQSLELTHQSNLVLGSDNNKNYEIRLIRLDEINDQGHHAYRNSLSNVYGALDPNQAIKIIYLLEGSSRGVNIYFGVIKAKDDDSTEIHEAMTNLRGALEGQLPGINFDSRFKDGAFAHKECARIVKQLSSVNYQAVVLGAPTGQSEEQQNNEDQGFQGVDRLIRALQSGSTDVSSSSEKWHIVVIGQPLSRKEINMCLDEAYSLSSSLAAVAKTSIQMGTNESNQISDSKGTSTSRGTNDSVSDTKGKSSGASETESEGNDISKEEKGGSRSSNTGTSRQKNHGTNESRNVTKGSSYNRTESDNHSKSVTEGSNLGFTHEIANKRAQHLMEYVDKQLITRLQRGLTKGLFHSSIYLTAERNLTFQRLKNIVRSTFQGTETTLSPLEIHDIPASAKGKLLDLPVLKGRFDINSLMFHSLYLQNGHIGSLLTSDELAIVASLPEREIKGVRRRKSVDFVVDLPELDPSTSISLGNIIDRGREYPNNNVAISKQDLNKHTFITGVTGAGKTTTCLNLLLDSDMPFLVIEPAKTEYRELSRHLDDVLYYRPNGDDYQSLRINPFALVDEQQKIKSHAGFLKNVFSAVFPMEASMPMMIEAAILESYKDKGWDVNENKFFNGDPFDPLTCAWPTMSDMIRQLDIILPKYKLGQELEEKYRGSLVSRLRSLSDGTLGEVLDVHQSIDFVELLHKKVVIELEVLQGGEEKALMMALIIGGVNQAIRKIYSENHDFRHLTLVEEAHRLLSKPEQGDKAAAMAVESFADMLAEVRKYGAGLIIADQIPAKLIPDVIKNTNVKIVHRLFAEDDRRAMGEAMMMDDEQRAFLPNLKIGEAIVFCGGWHGAALAKIKNNAKTDNQEIKNLDRIYEKQLWNERARYFPRTASLPLPWYKDNNTKLFADFVRQTRQVKNALLKLISPENLSELILNSFLTEVKNWYAKWNELLVEGQKDYEQWKAKDNLWPKGKLPEKLLDAAWIAMELDLHPKNKTEISDYSHLISIDNIENLFEPLSVLFSSINTSANYVEFKESIDASENRSCIRLISSTLKKYQTY